MFIINNIKVLRCIYQGCFVQYLHLSFLFFYYLIGNFLHLLENVNKKIFRRSINSKEYRDDYLCIVQFQNYQYLYVLYYIEILYYAVFYVSYLLYLLIHLHGHLFSLPLNS